MTKKKIFISGGSKGIGLATARRFYQEAYEVIICARNPEGLKAAQELMPAAHCLSCDVSEIEQIKKLTRQINEEFGALDVLLNNAGSFQPGAIHEEEDALYQAMMRTNMDSTYYMTKGLLPPMLERKKGTIVNMSSIASMAAYPNGGSYSISKSAMLGFSRNLREEMKPHGIRVISILPGATYTASWEGMDIDPERLMPAEDVAEMVFTCVKLSARTVVEEVVMRPQLGDL